MVAVGARGAAWSWSLLGRAALHGRGRVGRVGRRPGGRRSVSGWAFVCPFLCPSSAHSAHGSIRPALDGPWNPSWGGGRLRRVAARMRPWLNGQMPCRVGGNGHMECRVCRVFTQLFLKKGGKLFFFFTGPSKYIFLVSQPYMPNAHLPILPGPDQSRTRTRIPSVAAPALQCDVGVRNCGGGSGSSRARVLSSDAQNGQRMGRCSQGRVQGRRNFVQRSPTSMLVRFMVMLQRYSVTRDKGHRSRLR